MYILRKHIDCGHYEYDLFIAVSTDPERLKAKADDDVELAVFLRGKLLRLRKWIKHKDGTQSCVIVDDSTDAPTDKLYVIERIEVV